MGLSFSQIDDAVLLTQNTLVKRGAFVDMQTDLTDHVAVREMWKGKRKNLPAEKIGSLRSRWITTIPRVPWVCTRLTAVPRRYDEGRQGSTCGM